MERRKSIIELTQNSSVIILGEVVDQNSKIEQDKDRQIVFTYFDIEIDSVLKGDLTFQSLIVKTIGGNVGGFGTISHTEVSYDVGEKVIIFLTATDSLKNIYKTNGLYGRLKIHNNKNGKYVDCTDIKGVNDNNDKLILLNTVIKKINQIK
jgi:hypothetical protein